MVRISFFEEPNIIAAEDQDLILLKAVDPPEVKGGMLELDAEDALELSQKIKVLLKNCTENKDATTPKDLLWVEVPDELELGCDNELIYLKAIEGGNGAPIKLSPKKAAEFMDALELVAKQIYKRESPET